MTPHDEARLTAYALGELPAEDRPAVEAMIRDDPAARAYIADVRAGADRLRAALASEPAPSLSEGQRHMITHAPQTGRRYQVLRYALAAMILLSLGIVIGSALPWRSAGPSSDRPSGSLVAAPSRADAPAAPDAGAWTAPPPAGALAPAAAEPGLAADDAGATGRRRAEEVNRLLLRARELQKEQRYTEAESLANQALGLDPTNQAATMMREMAQDGPVFGKQRESLNRRDVRIAQAPADGAQATIPYNDLITYPSDWPQATSARTQPGRDSDWRGGVAYNDNHVEFDTAGERLSRHYYAMGDVPPAGPAEPLFEMRGRIILPGPPPTDREAYDRITDNPFLLALDNPLSTFSVDVDTASYANVRRFLLSENRLPPPDAVRIEELINYFDYGYTAPAGGDAPFAAHVEVAAAPWKPEHRLVRIGLKGYEVDRGERGPANLVFLLDVSGSMNAPDKLPLVKAGMKRLVEGLRGDDRVAIAVYAGASGLALESTRIDDGKQRVLDAIDRLTPGGSTNGAAGIELAYDQATRHFREDGVNRVILCTDGDFNVGITDRGQLTRLIEEKAKSRVYLSVLGFGTGNLQDATMEQLAGKGDGNYAYIDSLREAEKVLVEQAGGTLVAIAKDVKVQVEFNPATVAAYRLIGYENRLLAKEDFNDDLKDAGDIGSGHTVTALYEVVPAKHTESVRELPPVDELKYQQPMQLTGAARGSDELLTLKLRYKAPDAAKEQGTSRLVEFPVGDSGRPFAEASDDFRFAAAVAGFGMLLRDSPHKGASTFDAVLDTARDARGEDRGGYRGEFLDLVQRARELSATRPR